MGKQSNKITIQNKKFSSVESAARALENHETDRSRLSRLDSEQAVGIVAPSFAKLRNPCRRRRTKLQKLKGSNQALQSPIHTSLKC